MSSALSAVIDAGASLIGNIFGKKSSDNANATNMKIAQMNNEWSEKMMQKQMDYNTAQWQREAAFSEKQAADANAFTKEMWNASNEYNSAKNQAARLRAAGLNPAIVMSGNNAGIAQGASGAQASTPSGNSVGLPSPTSAKMQPFTPDFSGIGQAAFQGLQMQLMTEKNSAEINNLNAQADVARARAAADNAWTYERLKETKVGRQFLESTFGTRVAQVNADYQNTIRNGRMMQAQTQLAVSNDLLKQKELAIFDAERATGVANTIANTLLQLNQGKLTKQQIVTEIQRTYKTAAEAQGLNISNDVARRSADSIVENAEQQARKTRLEGNVIYPNHAEDWFGTLFNGILGLGLMRSFGGPKVIKGFGK